MSDNEIWEPVKDYEGLYEVSNLGDVKSLRTFCRSKHKTKLVKKQISGGYIKVHLSKNHSTKLVRLHRIIAIAFIENPHNKPHINHINGIKTDNRIENLEWVTAKENLHHALNTGLLSFVNMSNVTITPKLALEIYVSDLKKIDIAIKYKISYDVVKKIKRGERWNSITNHKKSAQHG